LAWVVSRRDSRDCVGLQEPKVSVRALRYAGGHQVRRRKCVLANDSIRRDTTPATNSCADRIKDGTETDVDCGGACARCGAGRGCISGADCTGGLCVNGACQ
jgi:hypothetical protein